MLPSSVRRVAAAAPQSPAVSSLTSSVPRAAVAYSLPYKRNSLHQRRYSSSKPSSPDGGSRDFAARPSVPASRGSKSEKSKAQAKEAVPQPPSVPSTRHIGDEGLALSTFFALHRPISVTQLLPRTVSDQAFAQIFSPKARNNRVGEVLSTLSQTVHDLEEPLSRMSIANGEKQRPHEAQEAEDGMTKLSLKHADGTETNVYLQLNAMSGHYLPYTPPPPPTPVVPAAETTGAEVEADAANRAIAEELTEHEPQTRVYKAMVTIEETVDADGQYKVVAHSPELVEEDAPPRSFLERMAWRQLRYDEARRQQDRAMQAISVRRQRKLRMKKKKYKKLMKRTRNLRRKQDRL
ncbi:uncharacterized protein THITE_2122112 [Thermothielavioides terrestris NRRL 8126]|uniref:Small ribosomal subunit protein mS38 n=1 Tax=Thermothielavioides terrestris (strain ATCC 38088 / NRRL 8126) TaxID=578455 RepID=G2RC91_THETT|nr:uncharacterized protein THITE_2122112 [Thermothielavioides terrestris NRRL 8126]AEO70526.1 hypothetical protein THITE_2122112 [Thermothielavioides terrestris NRRL 8126]